MQECFINPDAGIINNFEIKGTDFSVREKFIQH
jgi:hypothetical protein